MRPKPTGRVTLLETGVELALERRFTAAPEDVWKSLTEPDALSKWIGTFSGEAGVGKTVQLRMLFEQGDAVSLVLIEACDAPHRLAVSAKDELGAWNVEFRLHGEGDTTTLTFLQRLDDAKLAGDIGPGWEYYLDRLVAARAGTPMPRFEDYYPAQRDHYQQAT